MILEICPFCRNLIDEGGTPQNGAKGIWNSQVCLGCLRSLESIAHDDLSRFSRDFIDNLPYGIIIINNQYNVIRYNKTESKLSGLPIENVEGKHFFDQIAPCTSVREFKGELENLQKSNRPSQIEFNFTFNHLNFFAHVSILMTFDPNTRNTIISVRKTAEEEDNQTSSIEG